MAGAKADFAGSKADVTGSKADVAGAKADVAGAKGRVVKAKDGAGKATSGTSADTTGISEVEQRRLEREKFAKDLKEQRKRVDAHKAKQLVKSGAHLDELSGISCLHLDDSTSSSDDEDALDPEDVDFDVMSKMMNAFMIKLLFQQVGVKCS